MLQLGLSDMFDQSKADFSGIPEAGEPLFVSAIIQKAFIEVNEEGSEAAAATGKENAIINRLLYTFLPMIKFYPSWILINFFILLQVWL